MLRSGIVRFPAPALAEAAPPLAKPLPLNQIRGAARFRWNPSCITGADPGGSDGNRLIKADGTVGRRTLKQRLSSAALPAAVMAAVAVGVAMAAAAEPGVSLRGSPGSMVRQHEVALAEDFTFATSPAEVAKLVDDQRLVPLSGGADYMLAKVSYPYARPEVKTFVERVSADYRKSCGEQLVVTSLTRPRSNQPGNAHKLSVHPAGMAVDFRISRSPKCRTFMEKTLLAMERQRLLDITRERNPPHYHVAVFPEQYAAFAARQKAPDRPSIPAILRPKPAPEQPRQAPAQQPPAARRPTADADDAVRIAPSPVVLAGIVMLLFAVLVTMGRRRRGRA